MEVLSDILRSIRVEGSVYFCDQVKVPWVKEFKETVHANFHLIRRGTCWAKFGDRIEQLSTGDLIFLGPGIDHVLTSQDPNGNTNYPGEDTLLLCGYCSFLQTASTPLLDVFPSATIIREEEFFQYPWLKSTFDQLGGEYLSQNPGSELIVNKLTEVVLIELIRINFAQAEGNSFLQALHDKRISKALQLLHAEPEHSWTLELLANQIGMSRAAFAKRFKELVGLPMFGYLTDLRMQKAKELLRESLLPVYDIAEQVGYESERAFVNTFTKQVGTTPKRFRS